MSAPASGASSNAACLTRVLGDLAVREALDVGCGSGSFTRTLADSLGGWRSIVGVDPDKDQVDEARRLTDTRGVVFRLLDGGRMPYRDGRFDLLAISNALHHLDDRDAVLNEMRRVAAAGGALIVQELVADELTPAETTGRDLHHFKAWIDRLHGRVHNPTFARTEVRSIVLSHAESIEAECEIVDDDPGTPGSDRVNEAVGFIAEYLEFARTTDRADELEAEANRIVAALYEHGIATPPRLLIRARFPLV